MCSIFEIMHCNLKVTNFYFLHFVALAVALRVLLVWLSLSFLTHVGPALDTHIWMCRSSVGEATLLC